MSYDKTIEQFWKTQGLNHIKPNTGQEFPEGWDVRDFLIDTIKEDSVVEVGCGYGRLCGKFSPAQYQGFDLNPTAVEAAITTNPEYTFSVYEIGSELPLSSWLYFYTVLLHINDDDIVDYLRTVTTNCQRVLVGEILGRKWRRGGNPPVFNREAQEYADIMKQVGWSLVKTTERPYKRYPNTNITFLEFERDV